MAEYTDWIPCYQWGKLEYHTAEHTDWIPCYQWGKLEYHMAEHTDWIPCYHCINGVSQSTMLLDTLTGYHAIIVSVG